MSVRQYIGARYVPRFSEVNNGNWSNIYSYEPLTIVKNGNDYYTSKQSVPVGIAITNTDYWVKTGDYNGAISGLDTRVSDLEEWRDTRRFQNVLFVGDSYAVTSVVGSNTWATICAANMKLDADHAHIASQGSTGFVGLTTATFKSLMENAPITDKTTITDIVVCGGANDTSHSISDLDTAIQAFVTSAKTNYPNAKIHIGVCAYLGTTEGRQYLFERVKPAYAGCQKYGAHFIANVEYALLDPSYLFDGVHPTSAGCVLLGNAIYKALTSSYMNVIADRTLTLTPSDDVDTLNYTDFREGFRNGSFQFYSGGSDNIYRGFAVALKTDKNIGYGIDLGQLNTNFVWRGGNGCGAPCWIVCRLLDGTFVKNITGKLVISVDHLYVIPDPDSSMAGGWTPTLTVGKLGIVCDGFISYSA